ncbi:MAG: N-acylglucosamine 2-epimerase, partial [Actinomycetota bacterium]|nr:N-acylglucosamine 2-epimerase [Actinomycetota bacterium]
RAVGWGLAAAAALVAGPLEIAIVGDPDASDFAALRRVALAATSPGAVVALGDEETGATDGVPLLRDRPPIDGMAAAYVCRGFTCEAPTTSPERLAALIGTRPGLLGE